LLLQVSRNWPWVITRHPLPEFNVSMRLLIQTILLLGLSCMVLSCRQSPDTLHIIHAGSLTLPVKEIADSFTRAHPGKKVLTEAWGSKTGARRVSDLDTPCDVFISADYKVIYNFLIPSHASWNISFAGNEMVIAYNRKSRYADEINAGNWHGIMLRNDVAYGRSDPDSDPCGSRAVLTIKLSGIYYNLPDLAGELLSRHHNMIRPKETDLLALLETNAIDYIFIYRSVAQQHNLEYVVLPDEINLGQPALDEWYGQVSVEIRGLAPGEMVTEYGESMVYGITIPHKVRNRELAEAFVEFFLSRGLPILEGMGQNVLVPSPSETYRQIPLSLKRFALDRE
jgi:molybdate/tungstate transport system substrate-binding protein